MLLGFKARFVPMIEDGSKTRTIRAKRKIRPKVGETCHCYTGLRQKGARLLGRWRCVKVEDIRIRLRCRPEDFFPLALDIWIDGERLSPDEVNELAWCDGFRTVRHCDCWIAMCHYWLENHGINRLGQRRGVLAFEGDVIHWSRP